MPPCDQAAAYRQVPDGVEHEAVPRLIQSQYDVGESASKGGAAHNASPHDDRHTANISVDVNAPEIERISITVQRPGTDRYASGSKLQSMR